MSLMFPENLPPDVAAYFAAVDDKLAAFQSCSEVFDDLVKQQAGLLVELFKEVVPRYLLLAHAYSTPAMTEMNSVFKVLGTKVQDMAALANKNKGEESYQALMALQSASEGLNWVTVAPKPANAVSDAYDTCLYYANRVSKDKGEEGKNWVKSIAQLMNGLKAYIVDYHSSGLLWKGSGKCPANHREADLASLMSELDVSGGGARTSQPGAASSGGASSDAADSYLAEVKPLVDDFAAKSTSLGDPVNQQCQLFVKLALTVVPKYLTLAEQYKQPAQADFPAVYKDLADPMGEISKIADANFRHKQANFLTTMKTAAEVFNWIVVKMRPHDFVKETLDSTMFYGNRAIKDAGADEKAWLASLIQFFKKLQEFVKDFYSTGLLWKGTSPMPAGGSAAAGPPPPPPGGAPPPPPPPAMDPDALAAALASGGEDGGRAALFAEINQGTDITRGLKKVTKDMQTHKNPELRATSVVPAGDAKAVAAPKTAAAPVAKKDKPPRKVLEFDRKWIIENYKEETVEIEITNMKHTVYMFNCKGTTLVVKNKVNSISVDNCHKCGIVFDNLLSSLDLVNSKSIQVQALGKMPLLNIDKTDGAQVYLSSECLDCEIVSAKSSEMNLLVPQEDGDFKEFALPEQFITKYNQSTKKLTTECSESLG